MRYEVYLSKTFQELITMQGYGVRHRRNKPGDEWDEHYLNGTSVSIGNGRLTVHVYNITLPMADWLKEICAGVEIHDVFYATHERKKGLYKYKSATATVDLYSSSELRYETRITGTDQKDVWELYKKIRAGKILPTECWEDKQMTFIGNFGYHVKAIMQLLKQKYSFQRA